MCGSDHVTYKNACDLERASCERQENLTLVSATSCDEARLCGDCPYHGECVRDNEIGRYKCRCPECQDDDDDSGQICGSDGVQYKSECHLMEASCRLEKEITIKRNGACGKRLLICLLSIVYT